MTVETTGKESFATEEVFWSADRLRVTLDASTGCFKFEWFQENKLFARGVLRPLPKPEGGLSIAFEYLGRTFPDQCTAHGSSLRALVNRIKKLIPVPENRVEIGFFSDVAIGPLAANAWQAEVIKTRWPIWEIIAGHLRYWVRILESPALKALPPEERGKPALVFLVSVHFDVPPKPIRTLLRMRVNIDQWKGRFEFLWKRPEDDTLKASVVIRPMGREQLGWTLTEGEQIETGILPKGIEQLKDLVAS